MPDNSEDQTTHTQTAEGTQKQPENAQTGAAPEDAMADPEAEAKGSGREIPIDIEDEDQDRPDTVQVDADELAQLRADVQRFRDLAMRTSADLENYRKRMVREKEEARRYANLDLLESLLPVIDNFELGLQAAEKGSDEGALLQGMQMVYRQILGFLERTGVEKVDAVGAEFDPRFHEALSKEPSDEMPEGRVIRQIRNGYQMGDRLLRAANVVVSSGPAEEKSGQ